MKPHGVFTFTIPSPTYTVVLMGCFLVAIHAPAQPSCTPPPSGLVSWWQGENSTADAADGNTGTWAGFGNTNTYGTGLVGQAFVFDGTHRDRVDLGNPPNLQLQNFTIEGWIKRSSTTVAAFDVLGADGSVAGEGGVVVGYGRDGYVLAVINDGRLVLGKTDIAAVISTNTVADTNWHHVAVTKAGSNVVFYIDAVPEAASGPFTAVFAFDTSIAIGSRGDARGGTFFGQVDEPAIFNRALTTGEIQAIYAAGSAGKCGPTPPNNCVPVPSGAISWWRAEGSGFDEVSTNVGALMGNTIYAVGKVGQAFKFDGNGDYVEIAANSTLNLKDAVTLECWYKDEGTPDWFGLMAKSSTSSVCNYGLHIQPGGAVQLYFFDQYAGYGTSDYAPVPAAGLFHHVAASFRQVDSSHVELKTFIDGQCVKVLLVSGNLSNSINNSPLTIGAERGGGGVSSFFKGVIDEPAIYNRALSTNEILAIYNAGSTGKCLGGISPFIVSQPTNQTVLVGGAASFSVSAGGTAPLNYQWSFNGTNLDGATSASLTLTNLQPTNAGTYAVVVTNNYGSATSSNATLTVNAVTCADVSAGLVSWWRGQSNTFDQLGNNNGNLVGNATFAPAKVDQGFKFDGNGDYIQIPSSPSLNLSNGLTLECWYKDEGSATWYGLMAKSSSSGVCNYGLHVLPSGAQGVQVYFFDKYTGYGTSEYTPVPAAGVLHHIAATFYQVDPTHVELKTYIDGQCVKAVTVSGNLSNAINTDALIIGAERGGGGISSFFKGVIDEPAIYSRALSTNEIKSIFDAGGVGKCIAGSGPFITMQPTNQTTIVGDTVNFSVSAGGTQPLLYQWSLDGTNLIGATTASLVLNNVQFTNAGTYTVAVSNEYGTATSSNAVLAVNPAPSCTAPTTNLISWWRAEGDALDQAGWNNGTNAGNATIGPGRVGQAFALDGNGDAVKLGSPASLQLQNFTIEGWIRRASPTIATFHASTTGVFLGYGTGGYSFGIFNNGYLYLGKTDASNVTLTNTAIVDTNWHHVAVTKNVSNVVFYVDGAAIPAPAYNPGFTFAAGVAIGARDNLTSSFYGSIDELSVYGRALTTDEVQAVYEASLSGKCPVAYAPFIVSQPTNRTVTVGATATFYVGAGGTAPLSYQWTHSGTNLDGATGSSLTLTNIQFSQAGNYAVVVTNEADSVTSSNALLTVNFPPATVRVLSTNATGGGTVVVPVVLEANGNENALGFSLNFATSRLTYTGVNLGSAASGATLFVNDVQAGSGKLGLALSLSAGSTFPAGTQELVLVSFTAAALTNDTSTSITFGDSPIARQLSDPTPTVLPANYAGGTVSITAVEYEGDVSPRPSGDRTLGITDWVLAGRYAARLDYPTNASEFQRADCAPRDVLGNGLITVSDWVQAGRYAAVLDPATPLGGPDAEAVPASLKLVKPAGGNPLTTRIVEVSLAALAQQQTGIVRVNLEAQGDENALGFSLTFDPVVLSYVGASVGSAAGGATLNVNTNQAGSGSLGFVLALSAGSHFAAGTREIVKVTLKAVAATPDNYVIQFKDQPVPREVSSATAQVLSADYVNGSVMVHPPPSLNIAHDGEDIVLSWPLWASNFAPQSADAVATPINWSNVSATVNVGSNENSITLPAAGSAKFYRLISP